MPKDNYREYLRNNYKSAKSELQKQGKPHTKKDVYGYLRSKFYHQKEEKESGIPDPKPKPIIAEPEKTVVKETKRRPLNMQAFQKLYHSLIKI